MLSRYVALHAEEPVAILCCVVGNVVIIRNELFGFIYLYPVKVMFFGQRTRGVYVLKTWYSMPGLFNRDIIF